MTKNPRMVENFADIDPCGQLDSAYQRPPIIDAPGQYGHASSNICVYKGNETAPTWCAEVGWYVDLSMCYKCDYWRER
jgi:hypothetical protein